MDNYRRWWMGYSYALFFLSVLPPSIKSLCVGINTKLRPLLPLWTMRDSCHLSHPDNFGFIWIMLTLFHSGTVFYISQQIMQLSYFTGLRKWRKLKGIYSSHTVQKMVYLGPWLWIIIRPAVTRGDIGKVLTVAFHLASTTAILVIPLIRRING